jgi:two-component system C4-dicarboxylate transport sensor histidine kinase DctB
VFRTRRGDTPAAALAATYPGARIAPFVAFQPVQQGGHEIWNVDGGRYLPSRALHLTLELPVVGLTGEALLDVSPARQLATLQAAVAAALCLAFGALLLGATVRRQTLAEANARLEARVADRTAELVALNTALRREVAERTDAEARLHKAQADLVQAGKLSALGQMSAGISHELNQPLMAIRSFAENAEGFLARGKPDVAARNLSRISDLARRMGRIIRNLRAFARQESEPIGDVDLLAVIDAALEMVASKAHQGQVQIAWDPPAVPVIVRGGEVRLQQVILNLVSNAIDAMEEAEVRQVTISVASQGSRTEVTVADTGPGIAEPDRIFDPFYTTKQVGASEGVGLGLSISYGLVQSFGGVIRGRNAPTGGAIFTVELDASQTAVAA